MLEFDIPEILSEIEGKSAKEKMQALVDLYDELDEVMQEILAARNQVKEEYEGKTRKILTNEIKSFVEDYDLSELVSVTDDSISLNYHSQNITMSALCCDADWSICVCADFMLNDTERSTYLSEIAKLLGVTYKSGNDNIELMITEDELVPKFKEIILLIAKE